MSTEPTAAAEAAAAEPPVEPTPSLPTAAEAGQVLAELNEAIARRTKDLETVVATHPLAAVAAAFLLGIAVGRLTTRS